jgi:2'-5' RNA ligase
MADSATGKGHSLWLMPEGAAGEALAGWILRLAERYRTKVFPPHVTLVSAIEAPAQDLLAHAQRAAASLSPFTVHLDGVDGRDEHFRCLFVQAVEPAALRAAHEAVAGALGRRPDADFFPHLSLVYGALRPDQKQALAHEIGAETDVRFEVRRLHVWTTAGPVGAWHEVGVFPFAPR